MTLQEKYNSITCPTGYHKMPFGSVAQDLSPAEIDAIKVGNFCYDKYWNTFDAVTANPTLAQKMQQRDSVAQIGSVLLPFQFPFNNLLYAGIGYAVAPKGSEIIGALIGAAVPFVIGVVWLKADGSGF